MSPTRRLFAVIPAAGLSRRMGRPKLLLPVGDRTLIARLLDVLRRPEISDRIVVVRKDDEALCAEATAAGATAVQPEIDPPDMRQSVQHALAAIEKQHHPTSDDGWLLIPADHPMLQPRVLDELLSRWNEIDARILVPTFGNRRGHPTILRWSLADEISAIPADQGLNWLVQKHQADVAECPIDDPAVITDIDTPEDYERLLRQQNAAD